MVSGPFVVHFTALSTSHKRHSTIAIVHHSTHWMPAVTLFLATSCDPRCWCLRLLCVRCGFESICLLNADTRKEHDMAANVRRQKKTRNRTTIFHARIARIGGQEPTEYDNRLMCSARRRRERIKLEFVWKMKGKKQTNKRGFAVVFREFIHLYFATFYSVMYDGHSSSILRTMTHTGEGGGTNSWEKSEMLFCLLRQNSAYFWTRRKGATKKWGICQSKESVCAAKYHRSRCAYQMFSMSTLWLIEAFFKNKKVVPLLLSVQSTWIPCERAQRVHLHFRQTFRSVSNNYKIN